MRGLQLLQRGHGLREAIEGDFGVEVMHVVVANVAGEPTHDAAGSEVAGGVEGRVHIAPLVVRREADTGKVVLGEEEIGAKGHGDHAGQQPGQEEVIPIAGDQHRHGSVANDRERPVVMPPRIFEERNQAHLAKEDGEIAQDQRERVTRKAVAQPNAERGAGIFIHRHQRKRADVRIEVARIVLVVMVVRSFPNARRGEADEPNGFQHHIRQERVAEDRPVLMVVKNREEAHQRQAAQQTTRQPQRPIRIAGCEAQQGDKNR